jgi:SAM-dependent methyltransferase
MKRRDRGRSRGSVFGYNAGMEESDSLLRDVIEWDVVNWSRALRFWNDSGALSGGPKLCLELGARRGGLSLWLALQGHTVVCSDLQDNSAVAAPLHARYGVGERITYAAIDATKIPYENHFDLIAFKSMLGGVAWDGDARRQQAALQSIHAALKPGGVLLFAENLGGSAMHRFLRRTFVKWNSKWRYVPLDEMLGFLGPFSEVQYATTGFLGLCGRSAAASALLGNVDGLLFDRIVPPPSRYIVYGVARK